MRVRRRIVINLGPEWMSDQYYIVMSSEALVASIGGVLTSSWGTLFGLVTRPDA